MNDRDARMLIIDDDLAALDELADYFTRQGFRVDTAVRAADSRASVRAAQVYWWCREHPDRVRRLFPAARVAPDQPLRLVFVAERFTPLFMRALEQLRLADVRCLRVRDQAADGIVAVPLGEADAPWARGAADARLKVSARA